MAFCPRCGTQVSGAFCASCGTPVNAAASHPANSNPALSAALPVQSAPPVKKSRTVLWVLLAVFIGLVIAASLSRSKPQAEVAVPPAPLLPTPHELHEAENAGLSKDFATQGWILQRYASNKFMPLTKIGKVDEGLAIPSDEDLRSSLIKLKPVAHTDADRLAFRRMNALLWATHTATQLRSRGEDDPAYKQVYSVADDCLMAVGISFEGGTGGAAANAVRRCLATQSKAKADLDRQGISNWDNL
jgi:hypothetical protein